MTNDQLMGKYSRLRQELTQAYAQPMSSTTRAGLIDRLASELMDLERRIALLQPAPVASLELRASPAEAELASHRLAA